VKRRAPLPGVLVGIVLLSALHLRAQIAINGTVTNQDKQPISGALVIFEPENGVRRHEVSTTPEGAFHLNLEVTGQYWLSVQADGFYDLSQKPVDLVMGVNILNIEMIPRETSHTTLDVYAEKNLVVEQVPMSFALNNEEILSIPVNRAYFWQNTIAIMPGVLKDSKGRLHFNGGTSDQNNWLFNGFNIADPSTGQLEASFNPEAVNSFDLFTGRYSAEYGKGSGGTLVITHETGTNSWKTRATNFIPGFEFNRDTFQMSTWRPHLSLSGPLLKDRIWLADSLLLNYNLNFYPELPAGRDTAYTWDIANLTRIQTALSSSNTLTGEFLVNHTESPKDGLSPLDPLETTLDRTNQRYFFNIKDQISLWSKTILEFGYAGYRSINSKTPQGSELYRITPTGRQGNAPLQSQWKGSRDQWLAKISFPALQGWGSHQLKAGTDLSWARYQQETQRTGYETLRSDGTRASQVVYRGNGTLGISNLESAAYFEDQWTMRPWLVMLAALRFDRDRIFSSNSFTPWLNLGIQPPGLKSTRISAGIGIVPYSTQLPFFIQDKDQYPVFTQYAQDGTSIINGPEAIRFQIDRRLLKTPWTLSLSSSLQQDLGKWLSFRLNYLHKKSTNILCYVSVNSIPLYPASKALPQMPGFFQLQNQRTENYDSLEISLENPQKKNLNWLISYTFSRATSNAALDLAADHPASIILSPAPFYGTPGRLSWDSPNRLLAWMIIPIRKSYNLSGLLEWRDGFPFSIYDEAGLLSGPANSMRLPRYFSLNVHVERNIQFLRQQWRIRLGVDNLTNNINASYVNNTMGYPQFLTFYGIEPRKWVIRFRWLGRAPH
jgi:hypothetical protein